MATVAAMVRRQLRFTITITAGTIAFVAAGVLATFYYYLPKQRSLLGYIVAVAAAAAGVLSASYIGAGLRDSAASQNAMLDQQVRSEKLRRAADLSARWGDPAFIPARNAFSRVREKLRNSDVPGPDARIHIIEEAMKEESKAEGEPGAAPTLNPGVKRSIFMVLDFLEELALAVNTETADEEFMQRLWRGTVVAYWDQFGSWIVDRRKNTGQHRLYVELEKRADTWRDQ